MECEKTVSLSNFTESKQQNSCKLCLNETVPPCYIFNQVKKNKLIDAVSPRMFLWLDKAEKTNVPTAVQTDPKAQIVTEIQQLHQQYCKLRARRVGKQVGLTCVPGQVILWYTT